LAEEASIEKSWIDQNQRDLFADEEAQDLPASPEPTPSPDDEPEVNNSEVNNPEETNSEDSQPGS
jgi:hypothetical protein